MEVNIYILLLDFAIIIQIIHKILYSYIML